LFKPSFHLTLWLLQFLKLFQGAVVSLKGEFPAQQVQLEMTDVSHHDQKFFSGNTILFSLI